MKKIKSLIKISIIVGALSTVLNTRQAQAVPLPPGTSVLPGPTTAPSFGLLATTVDPWAIPGSTLAGTVTTRVYNDPVADPLGLSFTYDIHVNANASADAVARLGIPFWSGFLADANQNLNGAGSVAALSADRTAPPGDIIGFNFTAPGVSSILTGGKDSFTLILLSNATDYERAKYGIISGQSFNGNTYAPVATVPEGSATAILLGLGLLTVTFLRKIVPA